MCVCVCEREREGGRREREVDKEMKRREEMCLPFFPLFPSFLSLPFLNWAGLILVRLSYSV